MFCTESNINELSEMTTLESLDMLFDVKESFVVDESFAGYNVQSF